MKKKTIIFTVITCLFLCLTGCREVDSKIMVDYRFIPEHTEVHSDKAWTTCPKCGAEVHGKIVAESHYYPEEYQLLWEYRYDDGSKERKWETCTRFEYEDAKKELGG